jgi:predicted TIM-barrel fold metal-dependent hydrolase
MTENRIPLFIQHVETQWNDLHLLAETYTELNIIVESQWQKIIYHTRPLFNLMKAHRNIVLETSNFVCSNILEYGVGELGADRFIFGSFAPMNDPFVPIGMIIDARISDEEKILIAGDNLRHILHGVTS